MHIDNLFLKTSLHNIEIDTFSRLQIVETISRLLKNGMHAKEEFSLL